MTWYRRRRSVGSDWSSAEVSWTVSWVRPSEVNWGCSGVTSSHSLHRFGGHWRLFMRRYGWWRQIRVEQHVSTPRLIQLITESEFLDQRRNPIVLSFMLQFLQIDIIEWERSVAEIVEDESEELRVSVYEYCTIFILECLYSTTQQSSEECVLYLRNMNV